MPAARKRTTTPAAPPAQAQTNGQAAAPTAPPMPVVYNTLKITEYSTKAEHGPLMPSDARAILKLEKEKEFQERKVLEDPSSRPEHWLYGDVYHCLDTARVDKTGRPAGNKIRCWNNANNRPFDMDWCMDLVHTILHGQWAGPHTVPGGTVNCEVIRISEYGRVISGQHQLTALWIADEFLQLSRAQAGNAVNPRFPFWNGHEHCFIETLVATGMSEHPRVLETVDYVKPRTVADMLYTMPLFRDNTPAERKVLTKLTAVAIDVLWDRTDTQGYKTHPEVVGFLERHKRLLKCVEHIAVEDAPGTEGRRISGARISAGQAAALCYIMGSSGPLTDGDEYRNESPPSEKNLDWSLWDRARLFWAKFARDRGFMAVREAIGQLMEDDAEGLGGRVKEKLAVLAAAWAVFRDGAESFTRDDYQGDGCLVLHYVNVDHEGNPLPDGKRDLVEIADFYGIDSPQVIRTRAGNREAPPSQPIATPEEIRRAVEEASDRRAGR